MAVIQVDIDALRENIAGLTQQGSQMGDLAGQLQTLIGGISGVWEGAASEAYINKMTEYQHRAQKMREMMDALRDYIDNATNQFESVDQQCAARIRASF